MKRSTPSFPSPDDAAARYDAVLRRGTMLRRRHQIIVGAGTGGAALAVVLVAVLALGNRGSTDDQVVADTPSSSTTTSSTVPAPPQMKVTVTARADEVVVTVTDPALPDSPASQQCAQVRIASRGAPGPAVTEGQACASGTSTDVVVTPLVAGNGAEVGCSATATNDPATSPPPPSTRPVQHRFSFPVPAGVLSPGDYVAEATGVSGIGDGCPPPAAGEAESVGTASAPLAVP